MAKILLVEDEEEVSNMVKDWLTFERHAVDHACDGEEALALLDSYTYDLIILDWMLPKVVGLDVCKTFRSGGGKSLVLMLSGKSSSGEIITGLESGADDYLVKPCDLDELSAKVRALIRRTGQASGNKLQVEDLTLDLERHEALRGNVNLELSPLEFSVLEFFLRHPNQPFSSEALRLRVWGPKPEVSNDAVRTCIKTLRKKISPGNEQSLIKTVSNLGYCITVRQPE